MFQKLLANYKIILASKSPRRQEFLKDLGLPHKIDSKDIDESYPSDLKAGEITDYIARKKAEAYGNLATDTLLITSDTVVWDGEKALGKPENEKEALTILRSLSGKMHETISSVCVTGCDFQKTETCVTKVWFKEFSKKELEYYVKNFKPFDKAGAYGIQEWIGMVGVEKMEGSFYNVMGLPTHLLYQILVEVEKKID
ncbi:MAG TPA: Maf family nucleotide pyrophosphatase [Flavobacteriaceae bacterium]|nr:Maf family nucleotide pyrophosphatase [Flavobacteriaceae bacterium]